MAFFFAFLSAPGRRVRGYLAGVALEESGEVV